MKISGIYSITNTINGKVYYGSSVNMPRRWTEHKCDLKRNKHGNLHLQRAYNKYGKYVFKFEIIEKCSVDQLMNIEQQYLDWIKIMPRQWFYNISFDAECPTRGKKHSIEHKQKIASSVRIAWDNPITRERVRKGNKMSRQSLEYFKKVCNQEPYTFKNIITKEEFTGIRHEFYTKYNLPPNKTLEIVQGKRKSHGNWILVK